MDTGRLKVRRPEGPQPHWVVAHVIYGDDGPVVGVLWWDDDQPAGLWTDAEGIVDEEPIDLDDGDPVGWCFWIVGNESPSAEDPRQGAANVTELGADGTPADALAELASSLEDADVPSGDYAQSLDLVAQRLWRMVYE
jgi:hypothetical protein